MGILVWSETFLPALPLTWFSSCPSMLYCALAAWTSETFSPRRKPSRVMRVLAASSTDGGGPNTDSSSPSETKTGTKSLGLLSYPLEIASTILQTTVLSWKDHTITMHAWLLWCLWWHQREGGTAARYPHCHVILRKPFNIIKAKALKQKV